MYFNHVHKHFNIEYFLFVMNIFITNVMVKTQSKYLHFLVVVALMGHCVLSPTCHPSDHSQNSVSIDSTFVWLSGAISSLGGRLEKCNPMKVLGQKQLETNYPRIK